MSNNQDPKIPEEGLDGATSAISATVPDSHVAREEVSERRKDDKLF